MSIRRSLLAIIVCAGVTSGATVAALATQDARPASPREQGTKTATAPAAKAAKPLVVDPAFDVTLIEIREHVELDDEQWAALLERYLVLRTEQRAAIKVTRAEMARQRAEARQKTERDASGRPLPKPVPNGANLLAEKLKPLNDRFVAEVRGLLTEGQHEAWAKCVLELDLATQPRYFGQRPELRWRDPALGPDVGETAPPFTLRDIDGNTVTLSSLRGAPVAILFGSLSSPKFRKTVEQADMLQRAYREKVRWVIVYTFEAHPIDGWAVKKNEIAGFEIPQHKTYEERLALARKVRNEHAPDVLVLVDDMENTVTKQYFGHPNRFYLIGAEGEVLLKQVWFDERESTVTLYELLTGRSASSP